MTLWAVQKAYRSNDEIYYQVLPYNLRGTIKCHFEFYGGVIPLLKFIKDCRLTEVWAEKLADKKIKAFQSGDEKMPLNAHKK